MTSNAFLLQDNRALQDTLPCRVLRQHENYRRHFPLEPDRAWVLLFNSTQLISNYPDTGYWYFSAEAVALLIIATCLLFTIRLCHRLTRSLFGSQLNHTGRIISKLQHACSDLTSILCRRLERFQCTTNHPQASFEPQRVIDPANSSSQRAEGDLGHIHLPCDVFCRCECHQVVVYSISKYLSKFIGTFRFRGKNIFRPQCMSCRRPDKVPTQTWTLYYVPPPGFSSFCLQVYVERNSSGNLNACCRLAKAIPEYSPIIKLIQKGEKEALAILLSQGRFSLYDISTQGLSLSEVCFIRLIGMLRSPLMLSRLLLM